MDVLLEHHWLLTEVLREEWGSTDWWSPTGARSMIIAAVRGGLDLEMPPNLGISDAAVVAAVRSGELDESVLDESVGGCFGRSSAPSRRWRRAAPFHRGPSRVGAPGGARVGGAAEERRRRAAAAAGAG